MNQSLKKELDSIFYGKSLMTKGFNIFKAQTKSLKIPNKTLTFYYNNQEIVQIFKPIPPRKYRKYIPIMSSTPFERVYIDTMFITGVNLTIVNCVDLFSKYGYSMAFRGSNISSAKTSKALYGFLHSIMKQGFYITNLVADSGSEFKGSFKKDCKSLAIELKYTDVDDKLQASPIESFNRTIRLAVEKLKATLSSKNPITSQIEKGLKDIVESYNNTKHSSTDFSPMEILQSKEVQDEVFIKYSLKKQDALKDYSSIPVGSFVRVALSDKSNPFQKLSPSWTKALYRIKEYDVSRNRYILDNKDGFYEYWQLQIVDKKNLMTHTNDKYITEDPTPDEVKKSRSQKTAEKETTDYLTAGKYYADKLPAKRKKTTKKIVDL
jgi:hypothetical protein